MRLARPVYESLPYLYMAIGGLAILHFLHRSDRTARGNSLRHRCGHRDRGVDSALAASGLPGIEPGILRRDHRLALDSARLTRSGFFVHFIFRRVAGAAHSRHALVDVHDFVLADFDHVAVVEVVAADAFGLHEDAVGAVEVLDHDRSRLA